MTSPVVRAAGALTVAGAAALAWASLVEVRWYALREVTVAVLPSPRADSTLSLPSISSTSSLQMASPRPTPCRSPVASGSAWTNGS